MADWKCGYCGALNDERTYKNRCRVCNRSREEHEIKPRGR